jgi:hypothetical protein
VGSADEKPKRYPSDASRLGSPNPQTIGATKMNRNLKYAAALAMPMSNSLAMPTLAQDTWRDTEGSVHIEKPAPLDMEHAKADQKYRPILAVAPPRSISIF